MTTLLIKWLILVVIVSFSIMLHFLLKYLIILNHIWILLVALIVLVITYGLDIVIWILGERWRRLYLLHIRVEVLLLQIAIFVIVMSLGLRASKFLVRLKVALIKVKHIDILLVQSSILGLKWLHVMTWVLAHWFFLLDNIKSIGGQLIHILTVPCSFNWLPFHSHRLPLKFFYWW